MSRGGPDYGNPDYSFFTVETPTSDIVSERLGFSRLDNRGRVLFIDDFTSGLHRWGLDMGASGIAPILTYNIVDDMSKGGSVKIDPVADASLSMMHKIFVLPVSRRLGIEIGLYLISNFGRINIFLEHAITEGVTKSANLIIEHQTGNVEIAALSSTPVIIQNPALAGFVNRWMSLKIVANYETGYYERLMFGNHQYDISNYQMGSGVFGLSGTTYIEIMNEGRSATYKEECYLGYVIISGDEP